jgi:choline transport protein
LAVNIGALVFLVVVWIFVFFPVSTPVTLPTMNWNSLMFGATMVFAVIFYVVVGKAAYSAPVDMVKRR